MQGDQCLDAPCYQTKINAHIDREIAAHPELIQIENGYRAPKEQRPGAVRNGTYREVETENSNADAEPVMPCEAAKPALIVYGKRVGTTIRVCTDDDCVIHNPRAAARAAEHPAPVMAPAPEAETEEQAEERRQQYETERKAHDEEQQRRDEERKQQFEREQKEMEAENAKREKLRKKRETTFERIVAEAPSVFTAQQLRVILRALVNLDPYTFADDLATDISGDPDNDQRSAEEVLLSAIEATTDDKLTSFATHLALAGHRDIPRENELDFLTEAEAAFLSPKPKKSHPKKQLAKNEGPAKKMEPMPIKPAKAAAKQAKAQKQQAAPIENAVAA